MTRAQAHDLVDTGLEDTGLHERHPVVTVESIPACTGDSAPPLLHAIPAKVYLLVHREPLTSLGRRSLQRSHHLSAMAKFAGHAENRGNNLCIDRVRAT